MRCTKKSEARYTVLFFDQWAYGFDYISDVSSELRRQGADTVFLHFNSIVTIALSNDLRRRVRMKAEEAMREMPTYDLRLFGNSLRRCLATVKPSVVVTISMGHLADRVMKRTAQKMGIPVVFFSHGVKFGKTGTRAAVTMGSGWKNKSIKQLFRHGVKYLSLTWLYYKGTKEAIEVIVLLSRFLRRPKLEILSPARHRSIDVDLALAWSQYERKVFGELYSIPANKIVVTGSPRVLVKETRLSKRMSEASSRLLYVDQGLPRVGYLAEEALKRLIKHLSGVAHNNGLQVAVKLHPRTSDEEGARWYSEADQIVGSDKHFPSAAESSRVVVGHFSTALLESLALDRPIIVINWFEFSRRTDLFSGAVYPWIVRDKDDFQDVLRDALDQRLNYDAVKEYYWLHQRDGVVNAAQSILDCCDT